ncbi:RusA family crossover junction endodeoxyribonuclease [Streptomyces sp. NE06-03C]|uniref:RusA family crossover junction endodeoxyribonuclease n=1 Tax=Streptomyces sp. NE06-03C TaxID=3028694 RepID=UPI0029B063EC|nr:RusA family crossover junction endodeoxyribonuclease [Streptomyces sp. NE06-03C]MDX2919689.1 RusA family crossover junction endodeoxyribonuclease [Streptomyces sp. NE06-03C]
MSADLAPAPVGSSLLPAGGRDLDRERARLLASALAPGATSGKLIWWLGEPSTKARPRFGAGGKTYKTDEDEQAEAATGWQLRRAFSEPWVGNVALGAVFFRSDRRRVDVDNMLKHICDAGNGIAWVDDAQITALLGFAELDPVHPRTVLVVCRHASSLDRSPRAVAAPRQAVRR